MAGVLSINPDATMVIKSIVSVDYTDDIIDVVAKVYTRDLYQRD